MQSQFILHRFIALQGIRQQLLAGSFLLRPLYLAVLEGASPGAQEVLEEEFAHREYILKFFLFYLVYFVIINYFIITE